MLGARLGKQRADSCRVHQWYARCSQSGNKRTYRQGIGSIAVYDVAKALRSDSSEGNILNSPLSITSVTR
jgi:hypothetical protein